MCNCQEAAKQLSGAFSNLPYSMQVHQHKTLGTNKSFHHLFLLLGSDFVSFFLILIHRF